MRAGGGRRPRVGGERSPLYNTFKFIVYRDTAMPQSNGMKQDGTPLEGIGGWLAFFALTVIAYPLLLIFGLMEVLEGLASLTGIWQDFPTLTSIVLAEVFASSVLIAWACLNCRLFFAKKAVFPGSMIGFMCATAFFLVVDQFAAELFLDVPITSDDISQLVRQLVSTAIWSLYLVRSERVKNTFVVAPEVRKVSNFGATTMAIVATLSTSGAFLFLALNQPEFTEEDLQAEARSTTESGGGKMIDSITRFDEAAASGMSFVFRYTITTGAASEFNANDFAASMYTSLSESTCGELVRFLIAGVDFQHEYYGNDGLPITTLRFDQFDCPGLQQQDSDDSTRLSVPEIAANAKSSFVSIRGYVGGENISTGSGFVVRQDGVLVTNLHVLQGAKSLQVKVASGEIYDRVYILNVDERRDLAILQIAASGLAALSIGDDRALEVGDTVYALGNPLGFDQTFTDGILSAKRVEEGVEYLQISAPISSGSSGGPVLNDQGGVIGVVTAFEPDGQNLNIAMPSHYISGMLAVISAPEPFENLAGSGVFAATGPVAERNAESAKLLELMPASSRAELNDLQPWRQQVILRAIVYGKALESDGWVNVKAGIEFGELGAEDTEVFTLDLEEGEYAAIAICDNDCTDMDMRIDGSDDGPLIDRELDANPVINFQLSAPTSVDILIGMQSCATETCAYWVQLYQK